MHNAEEGDLIRITDKYIYQGLFFDKIAVVEDTMSGSLIMVRLVENGNTFFLYGDEYEVL